MAKKINKAEFSRLAGVSKAAITRATREGRVIVGEDGLIDMGVTENAEYAQLKNPKAPKITDIAVNPTVLDDEDTISTATAAKLKLIEQIKHTHIKNLELRGDLVSKELVQRYFSKLYMVDQNELKPIAAKVAPNIAAVFKSNDSEKILETTKIIEDEIYKCLNHIKRIMDDFLKNG
jgi:phage terminase Nu1 subunit (DNA packaging protein)